MGLKGIAAASAAIVALSVGSAQADEGMWTLDNVPADAIQKAVGFKPDQAWIDNVRLSSVRLAGGCSGSFVSPNGLVMTNHHCVSDCVAELSSAKEDLMKDGFLARTQAEERRCAGMEINQLVQITDVTETIKKATANKAGAAFADARRAAIATAEKECAGGDATTRCDVVTLYQGGKYHLYKYKRYQDVRLAFAPEFDVAAFGGDPDNFNFPRYCLDMSLLRVYDAAGKPIGSPNHFKWSKVGAKEGEAVFVTGHPGSTSRLDTMAQLETARDVFAPSYLIHNAEKRGRLIEFMNRGPEERRMALDKLTGLENGIKVWKGRHQALLDPEFMSKKRSEEGDLRGAIAGKPELKAIVGDAYEQIAAAEQKYTVLFPKYAFLEGRRAFDSDLANFARLLVRAAEESAKPNEQRLREFGEARLPALKQRLANPAPIYPELEIATLSFGLTKLREQFGPDHAIVKAVLGKRSPEQAAEELVKGSKLGDPAVRQKLFEGGKAAVQASDDPMIKLMLAVDPEARAVRKAMEEQVEAPVEAAQAKIAQARFALLGDSVYPDATFTLRLSYGQVKGWTEPDGTEVKPFTYYSGIYERATGNDPFDLPPSFIKAKDKLDMSVPFNAVSTNDIIGGNSGSPALNSKAEVIGLIFDGNIHSLSGDYGYDGRRNRSVWVDVRGMAQALKTVYGAEALAKELGL